MPDLNHVGAFFTTVEIVLLMAAAIVLLGVTLYKIIKREIGRH